MLLGSVFLTIWDELWPSENVCCTQMSPHFNLFPGKMYFEFSVPKTKGTIQTFISDRSKSKCLSWYGGAAEQTAWVTGICAKVLLTWRHILGLYRDIYCHQDDVFEDHASSHSACATTAWFRRDRVNVLDRPADLSHIENVWPVMKRRIRPQQSQIAEHLKSCINRDWIKM